MKKLLALGLCLFLASPASASNVLAIGAVSATRRLDARVHAYFFFGQYVNVFEAQASAGSATGDACSNALAVSFSNSAGNWGTGNNQIGAGTTVHLCGTVTSQVLALGNGAAGNYVTFKLETSAKLSQVVCPWDPGAGCFNMDGRSYVVFDGGTNGIIENTQNGSAAGGYASQAWTRQLSGIACDHCIVKNTEFKNGYVRTTLLDVAPDQGNEQCAWLTGIAVEFTNNVGHDVARCLVFGPTNGAGLSKVDSNRFYNVDHGMVLGIDGVDSTPDVEICNNNFNHYALWDDGTGSNKYHHDGIHIFPVTSGGIHNLTVCNNYFGSDTGSGATAHLFSENVAGGGIAGTYDLFGNLGIGNASVIFLVGGGPTRVMYNTAIASLLPSGGEICIKVQNATSVRVLNSYTSGCQFPLTLDTTSFPTNVATDYSHNIHANCTSFQCVGTSGGTNINSAGTSYTAGGAYPDTGLGGIDQTTGVPSSTSVVRGYAADLSALAITAMNSDMNGAARVPAGAGALQFNATWTITGVSMSGVNK